MTTKLDPSFLRTVIVMTGFRPKLMARAKAALLMIGLKCEEYTAAELPEEIVAGDRHISGAATGSLISEGLLTVVGRAKSPDPKAKGRKLDVVRLVSKEKAKTWLRVNGFGVPPLDQPRELDLFSQRLQTAEMPG